MKKIINIVVFSITTFFPLVSPAQFGNTNVSKSFAMVTINDGGLHLNISNRDEKGYSGYIDSTYKLQDYKVTDKAMEVYATKAVELVNICRLDYNVPTKYTNIVIGPQIISICGKKGDATSLNTFNKLLKSKLAEYINEISTKSDDNTKHIFIWGEVPNQNIEANVANKGAIKNKLKVCDNYFKKVNSLLDDKQINNGADFLKIVENNTATLFNEDLNVNSLKALGYLSKNEISFGGSMVFSILSFIYPDKLKQPTIQIESKDIDKFIENFANANSLDNFKGSVNSLTLTKKDREFTAQTQGFVKKMYTYNEILAGAILIKKLVTIIDPKTNGLNVVYNNSTIAEHLFGESVIKADLKSAGYSISKN